MRYAANTSQSFKKVQYCKNVTFDVEVQGKSVIAAGWEHRQILAGFIDGRVEGVANT